MQIEWYDGNRQIVVKGTGAVEVPARPVQNDDLDALDGWSWHGTPCPCSTVHGNKRRRLTVMTITSGAEHYFTEPWTSPAYGEIDE